MGPRSGSSSTASATKRAGWSSGRQSSMEGGRRNCWAGSEGRNVRARPAGALARPSEPVSSAANSWSDWRQRVTDRPKAALKRPGGSSSGTSQAVRSQGCATGRAVMAMQRQSGPVPPLCPETAGGRSVPAIRHGRRH